MLEPMEPPYTRPGSAELAIFLSGVTRGWDPAEDGSAVELHTNHRQRTQLS